MQNKVAGQLIAILISKGLAASFNGPEGRRISAIRCFVIRKIGHLNIQSGRIGQGEHKALRYKIIYVATDVGIAVAEPLAKLTHTDQVIVLVRWPHGVIGWWRVKPLNGRGSSQPNFRL